MAAYKRLNCIKLITTMEIILCIIDAMEDIYPELAFSKRCRNVKISNCTACIRMSLSELKQSTLISCWKHLLNTESLYSDDSDNTAYH